MVNKNLIDAIVNGDEQKREVAVYFTFLRSIDQCFNALFECADGCGKENALSIIAQSYCKAKAEANNNLQETLLYLAKRGKGEEG